MPTKNAARNNIANAEFRVGATEELLPQLVADGLRPDVIVLDPPRKGCDPAVLQAIIAAAPKRVVYVSCGAPTLARDAKLLAEGGYAARKGSVRRYVLLDGRGGDGDGYVPTKAG